MTNRIYDRHVRAGGDDNMFPIVVKKRKGKVEWGQSPGLVYPAPIRRDFEPTENAVTGHLEAGDRFRILMSKPKNHFGGLITRIEVRPVDGRKVGNSQNQVWIRWPSDGRRVRGLFRIDEIA